MKKIITTLTIISNSKLSADFFLLEGNLKGKTPPIKPGQFAQLEIPGNKNIYLRRPFSISNVTGKKISFIIKIVGKGTRTLAELKTGTSLSIVVPLGKGFDLIKNGQTLLVGGGCGIAPMLLLAKNLKNPTIIYGGKTKADIVLLKEFKKYAKVLVTTEDSSLGLKGFVTDQLKKLNLKNYKTIYTCGPEIMMKTVYKIARENRIPVQASLESMMGCGIGACLCCVTPSKDKGHVCVCTEGPVFNPEDLQW